MLCQALFTASYREMRLQQCAFAEFRLSSSEDSEVLHLILNTLPEYKIPHVVDNLLHKILRSDSVSPVKIPPPIKSR